jgi:DNA-directed RNA polymerase specialized sigma24 family protein
MPTNRITRHVTEFNSEKLRAAFQSLSPELRHRLRVQARTPKSWSDIAKMLDVTESEARARLEKILGQFKTMLDEEDGAL